MSSVLASLCAVAVSRADIQDDRTQNVTEYGGRFNRLQHAPDDHGTSHFNVVDKFGGAVVRDKIWQ